MHRTVIARQLVAFQSRLRLRIDYLQIPPPASLFSGNDGNATSIAFGVGYESPNQFSREYARLFGAPPSRDLPRAPRALRTV